MAGRFLSLFGPLSRFMPEVGSPTRKVSFNEKLFWTAMALVIYLVMSEINLFNIPSGGVDNSSLRIIFASNQGSLTELGIEAKIILKLELSTPPLVILKRS